MSRSDGFVIADVNVRLLDDPKVRRLWRLTGRDEALTCRALTLYLATVLASWEAGERVSVEDAAPVWLDVDHGLVGFLEESRLLDSGLIREDSWEGWFGIARDRRQERREAGAKGGRASRAQAQLNQSSSTAEPDPIRPVPTGPVLPARGPASAGAPAREGSGGSLKNILRDMGAEPEIAKEAKP